MGHPFANLGICIVSELGATSAVSVRRFAGAAWDSTGRHSGGSFFDTPTSAVVQPSTPKEIERLPENERTREAITLFTVEPLLTSDVSLQRTADQVTWSGRTYEVKVTEDWTAQAQYSRSIAVRLGA